MIHWSIEKIILELKYTWRISRNASDQKTNLVVHVTDGECSGSGEAAPNVRYSETPEQLLTQFEYFMNHQTNEINSLEQLEDYLRQLSISNALRFAIESAYVHYLCRKEHQPVFTVLGIKKPAPSVSTSYSIPMMDIGEMKDFYDENKLGRFPFIKIKIDAESGSDAIGYLSRFCSQPLIVDANEAFKDVEACIYFLEKNKMKRIELMEQPLPSTMNEESVYLKKYSPFRIFADESIISDVDFSFLKKMFHGVNIKLMKAGGYLNGVHLLREAKNQNLQTMIGCMVETTLGISSGWNLTALADYVDLDSFLLVKNEPFSLVEEHEGKLSLKK